MNESLTETETGFYWYKSDDDAVQMFYGDKDGYEVMEVYGPCKGNLMRVIGSRGGDEFNSTLNEMKEEGNFTGPIKNPSGNHGRRGRK